MPVAMLPLHLPLTVREATLVDGQKKLELGNIWLPAISFALVLGLGMFVVLTGFDQPNHAGKAVAMGIVALIAVAAYVWTGLKTGLLNPLWRQPRPTPKRRQPIIQTGLERD
jgi:hypothetical protein